MLSTTAEVAALFAGGVAGGQLTFSGSGDAETLAQLGLYPLTGGGENCHSISQVHEIVSLLNATPAVTEVMTVTGSGSTEVEAVAFQPLTGGTPRASISDVDTVVELVNETPAVAAQMTASGSGDSVVEEAGSLTLTGGRLPQSISTVDEIVGLLNATPEVTALMTVTGSGMSVVSSVTGTASLSGGRVEFQPAAITQYAWDVPGRLASVNLADGQTHRYDYDYRTRRIGTHQTASGSSTAKHTAIVFSGGLSLAEYESSTTQTTIGAPSMSTVRYVRGPDMGGGVGGLLSSVRSGERKYNLSNGRGDIVAQSNANATLTWTASYEAYGKRTKETGSNTDKQRANSKDEDPTDLLNEGFRYRDIETGAWLSRDPAGFVDGPNLYAYVKQNPWTAFDPLGLAEKKNEESKPVKLVEPKIYATQKEARKAFESAAITESARRRAERQPVPEFGAFIFSAYNDSKEKLGYVVGPQFEGPPPKGFAGSMGGSASVSVPLVAPQGGLQASNDGGGKSLRDRTAIQFGVAEHIHTHPSLSGYDIEQREARSYVDSKGNRGASPFSPADYKAYESMWSRGSGGRISGPMDFTVISVNTNDVPTTHTSVTTSLPANRQQLHGNSSGEYLKSRGVKFEENLNPLP